jgi:hypothetical protein
VRASPSASSVGGDNPRRGKGLGSSTTVSASEASSSGTSTGGSRRDDDDEGRANGGNGGLLFSGVGSLDEGGSMAEKDLCGFLGVLKSCVELVDPKLWCMESVDRKLW